MYQTSNGKNRNATTHSQRRVKKIRLVPQCVALGLPLWTEGDSFMGGANGILTRDIIGAAVGIEVVNTAQGGNDWDTICNRILATLQANPDAQDRTLVIWDGTTNGHAQIADSFDLYPAAYLDRLDAVQSAFGSENWIVITPLMSSTDDEAYAAVTKQILADGISRFGAHHFYTTLWEDLQALADGSPEDADRVALGLIPTSIYEDGTHLNAAAIQTVADAVAPVISNIRSVVGI